jgi:hypothetical protein
LYTHSLDMLMTDVSALLQQDEPACEPASCSRPYWSSSSLVLPSFSYPPVVAPMPFPTENNKRARPVHWDIGAAFAECNSNNKPQSCNVNNKRRKSTKSKPKRTKKSKKIDQQIQIKNESWSVQSTSPVGHFEPFAWPSGEAATTPGTTPRASPTNSKSATSSKKENPHRVRQTWTQHEDKQLLAAIKVHGEDFSKVQSQVHGRDSVQCRTRWQYALKPGLRKGTWSKSEDDKLRLLVKEQMTAKNTKEVTLVDWPVIAEQISGRSVKQVRERYLRNLDPTLKKGHWEQWEDDFILQQQREFGNSWARISRGLPGRTEHTVKTRWHSMMRVRNRCWTPEEDALLLLHRENSLNQNQTWEDVVAKFPTRTKYSLVTRFKVLRKRGLV